MKKSDTYYFCLDIGGTGTRGALFNTTGDELCRASGQEGALSLGATRCFDAIEDVWNQIASKYGQALHKSEVKLCAGIAGVGLPGQAQDLTNLLTEFAQTKLVGDGYCALIAATKGRSGALISVGTGIGALRVNPTGETQAVSSWGFPAGDAGSGAWIGLRLLGDFLKAVDGIGLSPAISPQVFESILVIVGRTPEIIMQWQMRADPKDFAALAPIVVAEAEQADPYCLNLLEEAAQKISRVANALILPASPHVYLGGGLGKTLLPFCKAHTPDIDWQMSDADPIDGVFLVASGVVRPQINLPRLGLK